MTEESRKKRERSRLWEEMLWKKGRFFARINAAAIPLRGLALPVCASPSPGRNGIFALAPAAGGGRNGIPAVPARIRAARKDPFAERYNRFSKMPVTQRTARNRETPGTIRRRNDRERIPASCETHIRRPSHALPLQRSTSRGAGSTLGRCRIGRGRMGGNVPKES